MTILYATDNSVRAAGAGDVAASFAKAVREPLLVLHVADGRCDVEALDREVARLAQAAPEVKLALRVGDVISTILREAAELRPRMVVIGAQGESARAAFGTVASAVAARVEVPVLVVRDGERLVQFFSGRRPLRALVATSLDEGDVGARDALVELGRVGHVDALLMHCTAETAPAPDDAVHEVLRRSMLQRTGAPPHVRLEAVVLAGAGPAESLIRAAGERDIDVIVCGTEQRRGIEVLIEPSVSSRLARSASCSVMICPVPPDARADASAR